MSDNEWIIDASSLSPFALKIHAQCRFKKLPVRYFPNDGTRLDLIRNYIRHEKVRRGKLPIHYPKVTAMDELPLTPFLFGPKGENLYDSSAVGEWLDTHSPVASNPKLIPADPKYRFLVKLIDEYADEFGLYLLHHVRWNLGAKNMAAPTILAEEIRPMTGPLCFIMKRWFRPRLAPLRRLMNVGT